MSGRLFFETTSAKENDGSLPIPHPLRNPFANPSVEGHVEAGFFLFRTQRKPILAAHSATP
jgi:hypothetical protein